MKDFKTEHFHTFIFKTEKRRENVLWETNDGNVQRHKHGQI